MAERQLITPTPYALYATQAGAIDWNVIENRPTGLDDGAPTRPFEGEHETYTVPQDTIAFTDFIYLPVLKR